MGPLLPGAAGAGREGVSDVGVTWLNAMSGEAAGGKSARMGLGGGER
jgi:hypothetical protein